VLGSASCIVVVPHLVKGGFIFGGKHGRGIASCRTAAGWSAPAFISIGGGYRQRFGGRSSHSQLIEPRDMELESAKLSAVDSEQCFWKRGLQP